MLGDTENVSRSLKDYCDEFVDYNDPYNKKVENDNFDYGNGSVVDIGKVAKNPRSRFNEFVDYYMVSNGLKEVRLCRLRENASIFEGELDYKLLGYPKFRIMVQKLFKILGKLIFLT